MRKLAFWIGFLLPVAQLLMYQVLNLSIGQINTAAVISIVLMLYSRQWESMAIVFLIAYFIPEWRLYTPIIVGTTAQLLAVVYLVAGLSAGAAAITSRLLASPRTAAR